MDRNGRDAIALAAAPYLTRGTDLDDLLVAVVDEIVRRLGADRGTLYLASPGAGLEGGDEGPRLISVVAHLPELRRIELRFGQGIAGEVAATGATINVPDPTADPRFDAAFDERTGYHTRSILAVPVHDSQTQLIGVLQLLNAASGAFTAADEAAALELTAQAGRVLEATSMYAELRRGRVPAPRRGLAYRYNHIVGQGEAMRAVYALVDKAARTSATVLITGESGTGKELIARAIHVNSPRRRGPFVKVDCTTLPRALVENELFGHERGAFTGADRATPGKVEAADGGTLFIDEIGELPLELQGKLLRVLQERAFERVGGTRTIHADLRVVCATHRDLAAMVDAGRFREDLYYRTRVVPLHLPPLRERGAADLGALVEHFVETYARRHERPIARLSEAALARLLAHDFPGNIRELEHCIESAVVLCDGEVIDADDLPLAPRRVATPGEAGATPRVGDPSVSLAQLELAHVQGVLAACDGNQSEAARRLGIARNTLARRLAAADEAGGAE